MAYNLTVNQFEDLNLFSNRNMEKIIGNIINESSNAVLVNMGDDSVIMLDHTEGQFYIADYDFDRKNLTLKLENFEPVELQRNEETFEETVTDFFEDEEGDVTKLTESYKTNVMNQDKFINDLVSDAMSRKDFSSVVNYDAIKEAVESIDNFDSTSERFFREYKERLNTHPLNEALRFDWENPVTVSLVETENKKLVNKGAIEKAHELWKKQDFKENFLEAAEKFVDDVEEGTEDVKSLCENYPQIFFLDKADRKSVFGKTLLTSEDEDLRNENYDDILKGIDILFEEYDLKEMAEEYLSEQDDEEEAETDDEGEEGDEEGEEGSDEPAPEVEEDDKEKLLADLRKVAQKLEDENAKREIDRIIQQHEESKNEGTRPDLMKETVAILSL